MNADKMEIGKYKMLNTLAATGGTVIFGGREDKEIPVCELKQSFELKIELYNRSINDLTLVEAVSAYDECVAPLFPERVLLHLGAADLERFAHDPSGFDRDYRELITHIHTLDRKCEITVISLKNPNELPSIVELNRHLKNLAESERCGFNDISVRRVWNPAAMKETISFMYSTGFVRPIRAKMPVHDLIKILYGYDSVCETVPEGKTECRRKAGRPAALPKASYI